MIWFSFRSNLPKRDNTLFNQERRSIFLHSRLDKMLSLFGRLVPKEGPWPTTSSNTKYADISFISRSCHV